MSKPTKKPARRKAKTRTMPNELGVWRVTGKRYKLVASTYVNATNRADAIRAVKGKLDSITSVRRCNPTFQYAAEPDDGCGPRSKVDGALARAREDAADWGSMGDPEPPDLSKVDLRKSPTYARTFEKDAKGGVVRAWAVADEHGINPGMVAGTLTDAKDLVRQGIEHPGLRRKGEYVVSVQIAPATARIVSEEAVALARAEESSSSRQGRHEYASGIYFALRILGIGDRQ